MNYEKFVQEMITCMKGQLSAEEQLEKHNVLKNNGVVFTGISVRRPEECIAPIIYLDRYYERYRSGEKVEDLSKEILVQKKYAPTPPNWNYRAILDFEEIKKYIIFRLIHRERNAKLLQDIPYLPVFDLAIVFYIVIPNSGDDDCSILIRNSHMNLWKVPISVLYEIARRNTPCYYPYVFRPLGDYIQNKSCEDFFESPLWILTNVTGIYGASTILYPKMPKRLYEKLGCSYYLLPSSIHEFLVVPEGAGIYSENLRNIVCEVNETQIEEEEVLADNVYYFDGKNITKM